MKLKLTSLLIILNATNVYALPEITNKPVVIYPPLLEWPYDIGRSSVDLSEPTSNRIYDLHGSMSQCDLVLSTSGNYHMALGELMYDVFLPENPDISNWFYTTSPPISHEQTLTKSLSIGNWRSTCPPSIAVGPRSLMNKLTIDNLIEDSPMPIILNQGNVMLVRKGNPKNIQSIWDLGRNNVRVVTSNPDSEPGSFNNYATSIYNIAVADRSEDEAKVLFDKIFNKTDHMEDAAVNFFYNPAKKNNKWVSGARIHPKKNNKWVSGARIHHREVPYAIAYDHADVGLMFYHLGVYMVKTFPDLFDIVSLGGTASYPDPLPGNKIGKLFMVKIKGNWTDEQHKYRDSLMMKLSSEKFSEILNKHGLKRP